MWYVSDIKILIMIKIFCKFVDDMYVFVIKNIWNVCYIFFLSLLVKNIC